ncbi:MAG: PTS sugar transporter subunit IIA [Candidatus Aminicenantia bacterium]
MRLTKYLKANCILLDLEEEEKDSALLKLVNVLKEKGLIKNDKKIFSKLMEREKLQTTAVEKGVAIPHCLSNEIKDLIIIFARAKKGVNFKSVDKKSTRLIFLLLGNKDNPGLHLRALARLARLIKETKFVEKTIHCSSVQEMVRTFDEEEGKI